MACSSRDNCVQTLDHAAVVKNRGTYLHRQPRAGCVAVSVVVKAS